MIPGICEVLGESLLGSTNTPISWEEFGRYMRDNVVGSPRESERVKRHRRRQEFYQDGGHVHVKNLIQKVIKDKDVVNLREQWVETANFNNIVKRIVNERSTVYQDPASRTVSGDANNKKYQQLQILMRQHEKSRQWNRLSNLHRTVLVQVRVRNIGSQVNPVPQPVFDIITPAECMGLVCSPRDPTKLEAVCLEIGSTVGVDASKTPKYLVWTNKERIYLNSDAYVIDVEDHNIGRMPIALLCLDESSSHGLWPGMAGEDLISAQMALSFVQVCLLKELKSATKVPMLSGDLTSMARTQAADTEMPIEIPEGVIASVQDMGMDLGMFRDTANHIASVCASNYGLSADVMSHQGTQSAEARDLMRVPLRELRLEQHAPLREFERELALIQSLVMKVDAAPLAFEFNDWSIDFADPQTPRGIKQKLEEFEHARRLRLTSTYKHVAANNPDLTKEKAVEQVYQNVEDELHFHILQRPFMAMSGALHGGAPPASTGETTMSDDSSEGRNVAPPAVDGREEQS